MQLEPCPDSPNCVSSDAADADHQVAPLGFASDPAAAWQALRDVVRTLPRTTVVVDSDQFMHVEFRSALFGFVDDVHLVLRPEDGHIAVRSASRMGYSDLGANRKRVERIRTELAARGVSS